LPQYVFTNVFGGNHWARPQNKCITVTKRKHKNVEKYDGAFNWAPTTKTKHLKECYGYGSDKT